MWSQPKTIVRQVAGILLFGVISGGLGSLLAIGFVEAVSAIARFTHELSAPVLMGVNLAVLLAPVAGGLLVGLLLYHAARQSSQSIADVVFAVQTREVAVSLRNSFVNALAAIIGMGSGASVGLYGPLAVMGANLGGLLSRWGRVEPVLAVGCGVAAVISTAFSAPLAAIIFVHEVILRHYSMRAFAPITVASSTGFFIANYLFDRPFLFVVRAERSVFAPEFLAFVVTGIVGAGLAIVFMRLLLNASALAASSRLPLWCKPAIAGLGMGLIGQWLPEVMGPGLQVFGDAIAVDHFSPTQLSLILLAKIIATCVCLGFGFVGGVLSPALLVGIVYGVLIGHGAELVFGELSSGIAFYGLCGMVAVVSPVIGGPLTVILFVFELTHNYELTTAVMISVVFSNVVAYRLFGRSLFDRQLRDRGFDLSTGRDDVILQRMPITSYIETDSVLVRHDQYLDRALSAMVEADRQECYVVDELRKYVGKLRLFDILKLEHRLRAKQRDPNAASTPTGLEYELAADHASIDALQLQHDLSVWQALKQSRGFVGESIPVLDQRGYFIGHIYQSAVVAAYLTLSESLRAEEHAVD